MKTAILAYFIAFLWCVSGYRGPVVQTTTGEVEGLRNSGVFTEPNRYLGIPFAKPPVGNRRFLKPEPVEPWSGTLYATQQPPGCMQYTEAPFPWYDNMTGKSEDCLYLNIFTPDSSNKQSKHPVEFWIPSGWFSFGSNRQDVYDAREWAENEYEDSEKAIVVIPNYRLGLFGFLTTNTSDAPGNVGLYDQLMALQWVYDNIENFGGDKNKITIGGSGAGAVSASILCVSPLARGLFSRAIVQSGSIMYNKKNSKDFNMNLGQQLAEDVGCATKDSTIYNNPSEVVECLRKKDALDLAKNLWKLNPSSTFSFFPQYGDSLLPNNALQDLQNGNFKNVPLLIGNNGNEGSVFLTTENPQEFGFFGEKDRKVDKTYAKTLLQDVFKDFPNKNDLVDYYLKDVPDDDYDRIRKQVYDAYGDTTVLCPTVYFAESYAKRGNEVYFYYFTQRTSNSIWADWMGSAHFDEVQYNMGRPVRVPEDYELKELVLSRNMMKIWTYFSKKGRPHEFLQWPKYSKQNNRYFYITAEIEGSQYFGSIGTGPHQDNCNFLRNQYGF